MSGPRIESCPTHLFCRFLLPRAGVAGQNAVPGISLLACGFSFHLSMRQVTLYLYTLGISFTRAHRPLANHARVQPPWLTHFISAHSSASLTFWSAGVSTAAATTRPVPDRASVDTSRFISKSSV
ncbi:hypothetical protein LIA77_09717 [Sarocladium implicatum]|nr:hypothetical protein LIA77_09717 [Sarocladium implicatum]